MRTVFYTNNLSPHQLPLAQAVSARVGRENFLFVYEERGWMDQEVATGVRVAETGAEEAREWLEAADLMYTCGLRPIDLMERRAQRGLTTLYASERWFKPLLLRDDRWALPGRLRLFVPWYRKMTDRFVRLAQSGTCVKFLPIGPWAEADFLSLGVPADKMTPWGYFVAPPTSNSQLPTPNPQPSTFNLLWVGRMLKWKRVDTLIRAVAAVNAQAERSGTERRVSLTLVGEGPERQRLQRLSNSLSSTFNLRPSTFNLLPRMDLSSVRRVMREHDLYVLGSDEQEGWGAVVNEALEEGMSVLATKESGAGAALLPRERQFAAGDWRGLADLIAQDARGELPRCSIGSWTAVRGAERLLKEVRHG